MSIEVIIYLSSYSYTSGLITRVKMSAGERLGAEEACWAHNPKVGGSKPLAANLLFCTVAFGSVRN